MNFSELENSSKTIASTANTVRFCVFLNLSARASIDEATAIRQQQANIGRADSRPHLAAIRCPTLVLVGEQDRLIPPDRSQEIAAGIAGSQYVIVPECGHVSTIEQPHLTTQTPIDWLNR